MLVLTDTKLKPKRRNAVVYCSARNPDEPAVTTQQQTCMNHCREHGFTVKKVFADEGAQATPRIQPALKALFQYCREGKGNITVAVVCSPKCISPVALDRVRIMRAFEGLHISLEAVDGGFSLDSESGLLDCILYSATGSGWFDIARKRRLAKEAESARPK